MFTRFSYLIILSLFVLIPPVSAAETRDHLIDSQLTPAAADPSLTDGKAQIYEVKGKAVLIKKGSPAELKAKKGLVIEAGDAIYTEKKASVSITFDSAMKNAVRIPEESKAVFAAIEPTDIKLENGSIFSAVDGLAQGSTWQVSTPPAVAAVRGTLYVVRYQSASGQFYAATVDVPDDKSSKISIQEISGTGSAEVPEGKEISFSEGMDISTDLVQDLDPASIEEIQEFFRDLASDREENTGETEQSDTGSVAEEESAEDQVSETVLDSTQPDIDPAETNPEAFEDKSEEEPDYKTYNTNS